MSDCIFCKIAADEIPAKKLYEDDQVIAFHDINPATPVHFLVIPKAHVESMLEVWPEDATLMGRLITVAAQLAREQGLGNGFRTIINTGKVGRQEVYHLHIHVLGGQDVLPAMLKH